MYLLLALAVVLLALNLYELASASWLGWPAIFRPASEEPGWLTCRQRVRECVRSSV